MEKYPKSGYNKDSEALHFYVKDVRILIPKEYEALKATIPKDQHKTILDILLITGIRYAELLRLYDNPAWYNEKRNIIHLPEEAQKKHKRRQLERTIHPLPSMFNYLLKDFWQARKPPLESTWNKNLQRWATSAGINPYGLSVKSSRKTLESWLIASGVIESTVCLRQGHDSLTSMRHYQDLAFSDDELRDIKKQLIAWGFSL
ncbi:MAG: site-specific integrase [Methanosarcina sp.]|nr:site-specific integrase [Methanosarcina sp.]